MSLILRYPPIATFSRRALFADDAFGVVALVDTNILVFTAKLRPPNRRDAALHLCAVGGRLRCIPSPCPPPSNCALTMGPLVGRTPKPYPSPTSFPSDLVRPPRHPPFGDTPRQAGLRGACRLRHGLQASPFFYERQVRRRFAYTYCIFSVA
jgi:hypothetical protein